MKKIDVAVLGIGGMGGTHSRAAKASPYVDRIFGYDVTPERTKARSAEIGIIPASLEEILNNPSVKLVTIAASNAAHVPLATAALKAGKAVMCEKPMGDTLDEARELIRVQHETGGFLQIGFELHYSRIYMMAKKWIDEGMIGTPVNIQTRYFCSEFHNKNSWRSQGTGSFLIGEKLSHYIDLQRWFFGKNAESVYSLSAPKVVEYFHHRDNHNIMTKFHGGGVGVLNFIMYLGESYQKDPLQEMLEKQSDDGHVLQYHIVGTKGAIETDVFRRRIRRWEFTDSPERQVSTIVETVGYPKEEDQEWIHNTHGQNLRIIELVACGLPPEAPAADAFETMRHCFAAEESEDTGKIIFL